MTEDERRERIEATASRMIAELLEWAANGEALPVQGAFVVRIRAPWPKRLATRTPSPSRRATWPYSRTWPRADGLGERRGRHRRCQSRRRRQLRLVLRHD